MSDSASIMNMAESHLIHTYNRYPIVLDHGDGVHLYDADGKEYLDFILEQLSELDGITVKQKLFPSICMPLTSQLDGP